MKGEAGEPGAPAVDPEEVSLLRATVQELRAMLEAERTQARHNIDLLDYAKQLLHEHRIGFDPDKRIKRLTGDGGGEFDVRSLKHPSLIPQIGVDKHFKSLARAISEQHRFTSQTTVRVKDLSYKVTVAEGSKPFPTVGDVAVGCLTSAWRRKKTRTLTVLDRVSAVLQPGKLYLVLGGPKEGKTSFLKAVAGRFPPRGLKGTMTGEVTFNGDSATSKRFDPGSVACFVEQLDNNEPILTVRETLEFAGACIVPQPTHQALSSTPFFRELVDSLELDEQTKAAFLQGKPSCMVKVRTAFARARARIVMSLLGLTRCADTVVGNEKLRGVRCLDEISTGLDSAATLDIVVSLRAICQAFGYVVAISLLQPAPEVFALFDEVVLVQSGRVVYQGSASSAPSHFASLGFRYDPQATDAADFLLKVASPGNKALRMSDSEMQEAGLVLPGKTAGSSGADELVEAFQATEVWREKKALLEAGPEQPHAWKPYEVTPYHNSWWTSFVLCFRREATFVVRDRVFLSARVLQNIILGIIQGTIYFQIPLESYNTRFGVLYQCIMAVSMKSAALIPDYFEHRRIFYKQKAARFFHPSAYCLSAALVNAPLVLVDALLYGSIVYWCAGLSSSESGGHYFLFVLLLLTTGLAMSQLFRTLSFLLPSTTAAQASTGLIIFFLLLFSGYITAKQSVPKYWIWLLYSNPLYYAFQALTVNEFRSEEYSAPVKGIGTLGQSFLRNKGLETELSWLWLGLGMTAVLSLAYFVATLLLAEAVEHPEAVSEKKDEAAAGGDQGGEAGPEEVVLELVSPEKEGEMLGQPPDSPQAGPPAKAVGAGESAVAAFPPAVEVTRKVTASSLPVKPLTLVFKDLYYSVSIKGGERVDLLKGVNGYLKPGTLTALMGSSGAGKTTLLDVLAGRKSSGSVRGDIRVNGFPVVRQAYRRLIGYVEQMDIHSPFTTIHEALQFSAGLRLSATVGAEQKQAFVEEVMGLLELSSIRDDIIGMRGSGLSTEQRKRVTIAVELVANPSLIFLDEPTSGLDARAALMVVTAMQRLARQGRTLVCTIHQPSTQLFRAFDNLLLLRRGGSTVFFGPLGFECVNLIGYLKAIPGTPKIQAGDNPATWMLGCIGAGTAGSEKSDYAGEYARSALCVQNAEEIARLLEPQPGDSPPQPPQAAGWSAAFWACTHRALRSYYRQPSYNFVRIVLCMVVALILASVYAGQTQDTAADLIGFVGVIFLSTMFIGAINTNAIIQVVHNERSAFYRERFLKLYPVSAYALSWLVAELPYVFVLVGSFINVWYWACGYSRDADRFLMYWLYLFEIVTFYTYFGQFLAAASPTVQTAQILVSTLNPIFATFSGFTIIPSDIPSFWKFLYYGTPLHWAIQGMVVTQWHGDNQPVTFFSAAARRQVTTTRWAFIDAFFKGGFNWEDRWVCVAVLAGFIFAARLGFFLSLSKLKYGVR